jgi:lipoprotein-anchoring transpeptidase ErfK/SrfK
VAVSRTRLVGGSIAVVVFLGLGAGACGHSGGRSAGARLSTSPVAHPTIAAPSPSPRQPRPPARPAPPVLRAVLTNTSATVAIASNGVTVFTKPAGPVQLHLSGTTPLGATRTLLVEKEYGEWLQVLLPLRPNGLTGWIRKSEVQVATVPWRIQVDVARRTLTLLDAGKPALVFPVAVGAAATPTPGGLFFITDRISLDNPYGAYGPSALGISGYSDVLTSFNGGDGVIGIHGTNADWSIGQAVTHGCIRLHNADMVRLFASATLGTPVFVS